MKRGAEAIAGTNGPQQPRLSWPARCYLWATHRLYDELAWAYDAVSWLAGLGRWSRWRAAALEPLRGGRVLEIGFGTGELLLEMARRGWQVCGLEPAPAMQRLTAHKLRRRGLAAARVRGYAQALPFADGTFDAVVATFPAEYILAPATWHEAARVLRPPDPATSAPGGCFVVTGLTIEVEGALLRWLTALFPGWPRRDPETRCRQLAAAAGFRLTVIREEAKRLRVPVFVMERRQATPEELEEGG